jgi:hypothetical protein
MSDLVGIQEVRWDRRSTKPAGKYAFLYGKENENHELHTGFVAHKRIISAVKRVQSVSDRLVYTILRGRWCSSVQNAHDPTEHKIDEEGNFYEKLKCVFNKFPIYHEKFYYMISMQKQPGKSNIERISEF